MSAFILVSNIEINSRSEQIQNWKLKLYFPSNSINQLLSLLLQISNEEILNHVEDSSCMLWPARCKLKAWRKEIFDFIEFHYKEK